MKQDLENALNKAETLEAEIVVLKAALEKKELKNKDLNREVHHAQK